MAVRFPTVLGWLKVFVPPPQRESLLSTLNTRTSYLRLVHTKKKPRNTVVLPREPLSEKNLRGKFVDSLTVRAKGGDGGDGKVAFTSLARKEWAGPDGGDGGSGGHVVIVSSSQVKSLSHVSRAIRGSNGVDGRNKCQHGKNAQHTMISVPLGTLVRDQATGEILAELSNNNQHYILARGGAGGKGNHFYLSNDIRAPAIAENGGKGEEKELLIEMKVTAHIGLIGFPNAGKSTLLTALSRAKPKIADYPFTTLNPHIGMVPYEDGLQVAVADIPGLIEGSHLNKGLGISFLRHVEKCSCLLYVIDVSADEPWKALATLRHELETYQQHLSKRPHAIIGNKMDLPDSIRNLPLLRSEVDLPVIPVSGRDAINIGLLKSEIRKLYDKYKLE